MEAIKIAREALVKPFEGYHKRLPDGGCKAYPDPGTGGHPWTIGYGSTGPEITPETVWTHKQAEDALDEHLEFFNKGLLKLSPKITQHPKRHAAVLSFCYNCGLRNYQISTLRKMVNEERWDEAASEILKWNKAAGRVLRGLTIRRQAESMLLR